MVNSKLFIISYVLIFLSVYIGWIVYLIFKVLTKPDTTYQPALQVNSTMAALSITPTASIGILAIFVIVFFLFGMINMYGAFE